MADMIYKNQIKVVVTTQGAYTATFDDSANAGVGASAYAALQAHQDIVGVVGDDTIFIPFEAVDHAVVTISRTQVEKPADEMCTEDSGKTFK